MFAQMAPTLKILVVEDDADDALLLQRALGRSSFAMPVQFVRDGQEAVDYLEGRDPFMDRRRHPLPSLILLDLKMPRMDGFEVLEWLRQQPVLGRLLVVVLSASPREEDINRAYALGANSYLVKPNDSAQLNELVMRLEKYWLLTCARIPSPETQVGRGFSAGGGRASPLP